LAHLSTVLIVTDTEGTVIADAVGPETTDVEVNLGHALVSKEEPKTEDGLGKDIKNSVGNDLSVNAGLARAVGNTPDTV
jgi:hypothetical protein